MMQASELQSKEQVKLIEQPKNGTERLRNEILKYFLSKKCVFPKGSR